MTKPELLELLGDIGVLQTGHFQLTSGLHSNQYMQCATIFERPQIAEKIVTELTPKLPREVETVIAPAIGGINMGYEVARDLNCRFIFAEREQGVMKLRRGFSLRPGEKVLVVEDVVTTGGSVKEVLAIAKEQGCEILGVASIVDRSNGKAEFGVPFISILPMQIQSYPPEQCPMCQNKIPITKPGSRQN